jgi:hypothetical protein
MPARCDSEEDYLCYSVDQIIVRAVCAPYQRRPFTRQATFEITNAASQPFARSLSVTHTRSLKQRTT